MKTTTLAAFLIVLAASAAPGQQARRIPSVADLIAGDDTDKDGKISKAEAEAAGRPAGQFAKWDADKDGHATSDEIIAMRKRYGIDAEGKRTGNRPERDTRPAKLTIPSIDEITRTGSGRRPTREEQQWSLSILGTKPHEVGDGGYLILTDHTDEAWLESLYKLAAHRDAEILKWPDLANLHANEESWAKALKALKKANPRYVAIAPRLESYREKMLIGMWKLLSGLDDDPELDVFPGLLVAPDAPSLAKLVESSIRHKPQSAGDFRPFAQCHFTDLSAGGIKSLQKVGILRNHFAAHGYETPSLIIADKRVGGKQPLAGDDIVYATPERRLLKSFPADSRAALEDSSLLIMFGHGSPGKSCGISVDAFAELDLDKKVVMAGSCWSAVPVKLDFPLPRRDAAGTEISNPESERLLLRAVENGAVVSFGHMRLNQGFLTLYPVLEAWTDGKTVGEAYQQLMNALIQRERASFDDILELGPAERDQSGAGGRSPAIPGNRLLYVIIGDPALQPFEKLQKKD